MKRNLFFRVVFAIITPILFSACLKLNFGDAPTYQPSGPKYYVYQYGPNIPIQGAVVSFWFGGSSFNGTETYTDKNGMFHSDARAISANIYKVGFWYPILKNKQPDSSNRYFLCKNAWVKFHVSNSKDTDVIEVTDFIGQPVENILFWKYNAFTDTTTRVAIGDAENSYDWGRINPDPTLSNPITGTFPWIGAVKTDSFYVKSGDTAFVDLKVH